jgi:hypothetical protein
VGSACVQPVSAPISIQVRQRELAIDETINVDGSMAMLSVETTPG